MFDRFHARLAENPPPWPTRACRCVDAAGHANGCRDDRTPNPMAQPVIDTLRVADALQGAGMRREQAEGGASTLGTRLGQHVAVRRDLDLGFERILAHVDERFAQVDKQLAEFRGEIKSLHTKCNVLGVAVALALAFLGVIASFLAVIAGPGPVRVRRLRTLDERGCSRLSLEGPRDAPRPSADCRRGRAPPSRGGLTQVATAPPLPASPRRVASTVLASGGIVTSTAGELHPLSSTPRTDTLVGSPRGLTSRRRLTWAWLLPGFRKGTR